jgi:hypothetical protein
MAFLNAPQCSRSETVEPSTNRTVELTIDMVLVTIGKDYMHSVEALQKSFQGWLSSSAPETKLFRKYGLLDWPKSREPCTTQESFQI